MPGRDGRNSERADQQSESGCRGRRGGHPGDHYRDAGEHGYFSPAGRGRLCSECGLRRKDTGGCGKDPEKLPGDSADCQRGEYGREHRQDH